MKDRTETVIAILLGLALLISIANEFVSGRINSNLQKQIEQDLELSKAYGETSARWLEVNEMLQRNLALTLEGLSNKTLEESGKFKKEDFSDQDWQYWRNKKVIKFWEHRYKTAWDSLRRTLDETNEKRNKQKNFLQKNKGWDNLESILRVVQMCLIIASLLLYGRMIRPQSPTLEHNQHLKRTRDNRAA